MLPLFYAMAGSGSLESVVLATCPNTDPDLRDNEQNENKNCNDDENDERGCPGQLVIRFKDLILIAHLDWSSVCDKTRN